VDDGHSNGLALAADFPTVLTAPSIEPLLTRALRSLGTPHRRAARRASHAAVVVIPSAGLGWYVTRPVAVLTQAGQALTEPTRSGSSPPAAHWPLFRPRPRHYKSQRTSPCHRFAPHRWSSRALSSIA
jgi:hypothetical protein